MEDKIIICKGKLLIDEGVGKTISYRLLEDNKQNHYISKQFDNTLQDDLHMIIKKDGQDLFNGLGICQYKNCNNLWKLFIGDRCIDDILWDNVGEELEIKFDFLRENILK